VSAWIASGTSSAGHIICKKWKKGLLVRHVVRRFTGQVAWVSGNCIGIWFDNGTTYDMDRSDADVYLEIIQ
jgi:hypothetical protein